MLLEVLIMLSTDLDILEISARDAAHHYMI